MADRKAKKANVNSGDFVLENVMKAGRNEDLLFSDDKSIPRRKRYCICCTKDWWQEKATKNHNGEKWLKINLFLQFVFFIFYQII